MSVAKRLLDVVESAFVAALCRVDDEALEAVPHRGPLIIVANHINFLEIPVLHSRLRTRDLVALAKAEAWESRIQGWLFDHWGAIPVRRGEQDLGALRQCLDVLSAGRILVIAPEGTRSRHGRLQRARSGVVPLALRSGAPILPIAFHGGEQLKKNLRHLRRTPFHIQVGPPFRLATPQGRIGREDRQRMTDEIMGQIARLLPKAFRGVYAQDAERVPQLLSFDVAI
jgi:1-acyl-sn-glycerol-3-phosphate acyltransferase